MNGRLSWNEELRVNAVFHYNNWMRVYFLTNLFIPGGLCHHRGADGLGCPTPAASRILCNIWGTVAEYETCEEHTWYHGKLLDDFPLRKQ